MEGRSCSGKSELCLLRSCTFEWVSKAVAMLACSAHTDWNRKFLRWSQQVVRPPLDTGNSTDVQPAAHFVICERACYAEDSNNSWANLSLDKRIPHSLSQCMCEKALCIHSLCLMGFKVYHHCLLYRLLSVACSQGGFRSTGLVAHHPSWLASIQNECTVSVCHYTFINRGTTVDVSWGFSSGGF